MKRFKYRLIYRAFNDVTRENSIKVLWRDADGRQHSGYDTHYPRLIRSLEKRGYEPSNRWFVRASQPATATTSDGGAS